MSHDKNIFKSIREGRIIQTVLDKGIGAAAENFNIEKSEVNKIILKAIEGHQKMIKIHQVSIVKLHNRLEKKDPNMGLKLDGCYFCGESGHVARDCSCYKCGKSGHLGKDCSYDDDNGVFGGDGGGGDDGGRGGRVGCRKCRQCGHEARRCDHGGGDCVCYNCGEAGHIAWECSHSCAECSESGHMSKDCPQIGCFSCGQNGHYPWECLSVKESSGDDKVYCCICGGEHRAKDCSSLGCYKCSKVGHLGKDCGQVWRGGGGGVCYYCGLNGYMAVCSLCGVTAFG
nr:protein RNA-directed DNA methylation 3 isoform X2 [Tanacetum cinerariifolium]